VIRAIQVVRKRGTINDGASILDTPFPSSFRSNGEIFLADSRLVIKLLLIHANPLATEPGTIKTFASDLKDRYRIAFYPRDPIAQQLRFHANLAFVLPDDPGDRARTFTSDGEISERLI
jgi:hypothetical protein